MTTTVTKAARKTDMEVTYDRLEKWSNDDRFTWEEKRAMDLVLYGLNKIMMGERD